MQWVRWRRSIRLMSFMADAATCDGTPSDWGCRCWRRTPSRRLSPCSPIRRASPSIDLTNSDGRRSGSSSLSHRRAAERSSKRSGIQCMPRSVFAGRTLRMRGEDFVVVVWVEGVAGLDVVPEAEEVFGEGLFRLPPQQVPHEPWCVRVERHHVDFGGVLVGR